MAPVIQLPSMVMARQLPAERLAAPAGAERRTAYAKRPGVHLLLHVGEGLDVLGAVGDGLVCRRRLTS